MSGTLRRDQMVLVHVTRRDYSTTDILCGAVGDMDWAERTCITLAGLELHPINKSYEVLCPNCAQHPDVALFLLKHYV